MIGAVKLNAIPSGTPPAPSTRPRGQVGRPRDRPPEETRRRILDAAERLFAEGGYDGTSLRDVASAADVQLNAVGYHFGPKDVLFDTVVGRRAAIMSEMRGNALAEILDVAGDARPHLEDLIRAYVAPFIHSAGHGERGWRNYAALMGRLANSMQGTEIIARHYDDTARAYLDALRKALPGARQADLVDGFGVLIAAMLGICADTGRRERLGAAPAHRKPEENIAMLTTFHAAGLRALEPGDGG